MIVKAERQRNNIGFERQSTFGIYADEGITLLGTGSESIKYSGILNSSRNYISGTYLETQIWPKPFNGVRIWSGRFEMWKIN